MDLCAIDFCNSGRRGGEVRVAKAVPCGGRGWYTQKLYIDIESTASCRTSAWLVEIDRNPSISQRQLLLERARLLRNHGMTREPETFTEHTLAFDVGGAVNPWHYEMAEPGLNYRASDMHCALGLSQLAKLTRFANGGGRWRLPMTRASRPWPLWSGPCRGAPDARRSGISTWC